MLAIDAAWSAEQVGGLGARPAERRHALAFFRSEDIRYTSQYAVGKLCDSEKLHRIEGIVSNPDGKSGPEARCDVPLQFARDPDVHVPLGAPGMGVMARTRESDGPAV